MYELKAEARETVSKSSTSGLRRDSKVPAVLYGQNGTSHVAITKRDVEFLIKERGTSGLISLLIEGGDNAGSSNVIFKNLQFDYLRKNVIHIDFQSTKEDSIVKIKVPIKGIGTPHGVMRQGGVLQQNALEAEISCLPKDIPDFIPVDIEKMNLNDIIRAADIKGFDFSLASQSFFTVATSRAARKMAETADEE
ncbi:MAG: 50S ribosomal protein L25 [Candidatus Cloacimonadota bacterium]|nr:MAG: 50S ribosomal protein L25 [Candidatus Cloacimonadota bacterium]